MERNMPPTIYCSKRSKISCDCVLSLIQKRVSGHERLTVNNETYAGENLHDLLGLPMGFAHDIGKTFMVLPKTKNSLTFCLLKRILKLVGKTFAVG